jgi:hypothetical protein
MARGSGPIIEGRLRGLLDQLSPQVLELGAAAKSRAVRSIRSVLIDIEDAARAALERMDPTAVPQNVFDPTNPDVAAWTVVLALSAQPRVKLAEVAPEYGAGVYALYYVGDHPHYRSISGTETPIYVGKTDHDKGTMRGVRTHGAKLTERLGGHRRQIRMAEKYAIKHTAALTAQGLHPLALADVECRKLVCAPGIQLTAESRLIDLFRPLWNSKFDVAYGISKNGDRQRKHPKSPWDVLHSGRPWADGLK